MEGQQPHILLSSMGIRPQSATYSWKGAFETSTFSAMALCKLLPSETRPEEIWFLLTPEAGQNWSRIQAEAKSFGMTVKPIDLTGDLNDAADFLEQTARRIPEHSRLTLNVTDGLRHHAFLFYALALYLTAFRDVHIEGVWYCRLETENRDDPKPLIDLKPVLELARWFHALAVFRETGALRGVSELLELHDARSLVKDLSFFFLNGLPLEAGDTASRLMQLADRNQLVANLPLAKELHRMIVDGVRPLAGATFEPNPRAGEPAKKALPLTEDEIQRQAIFIERYLRNDQLNLAFGLLREWNVNWIATQCGHSEKWLDRRERESIEHRLGGLGEVLKSKLKDNKTYKHAAVRELLSDTQREWGKRWNRACDIRNALQHHGMKAAVFEPKRADIVNAECDWLARHNWSPLPVLGGGLGRLLICPIGLTPGVLYSAIRHTIPDRVLVVCSNDSAGAIDDALAKAGRTVEVRRMLMTNAFTGIDEFASLISDASAWLFEADEVHANLTGGTTLMGALVGEFVKRAAREYQRPVREFVLIDKRSPEQQRTDPWRVGDIHYMDGGSPDPIDPSPEVQKSVDAVAAHESPSDDPRTPTEDRA